MSLLMLLLFLVYFNQASLEKKDPEIWKKAQKIHNEAIVFDAHAHSLISGKGTIDDLDLGRKTGQSQVDFVTMKEGGLDALFLSLPIPSNRDTGNPSKRILDSVDKVKEQIKNYPDLSKLALTAADVRQIHDSGKRAVLLSIECRYPLEGHVIMLEPYYKLGIRVINVQHSKIDHLANSDTDNAGESGLSDFGKKVVQKMNQLGMLIDITHTPDNLQMDIIDTSKAPVIASHSCVRALHDIPRNIPDHILRALSKNGGAIMITFSSGLLSADFTRKWRKADAVFELEEKKLKEKFKDDKTELDKRLYELWKRLEPTRVDIGVLVDHIDHAVKIAGINHVGLGSDFVGHPNAQGLESAQGFPLITYQLLKRGYKEDEIKKILGGNLLRVFEDVEKQAKKN
ncbi:MAG: membrane dipeptidase [Candidatus Aminicenantes bacterium]